MQYAMGECPIFKTTRIIFNCRAIFTSRLLESLPNSRVVLVGGNRDYEILRVCPRGVIVKAMDCGIVVSEFVLQSRYYVHF